MSIRIGDPFLNNNWKKCSCKHLAVVWMRGYAEGGHDIFLCEYCAVQLVRKIMEDLCELKGDRHG